MWVNGSTWFLSGFGTGTTTTQSSLLGGGSLFSTGFGTSGAPAFGTTAANAAGTTSTNPVANLASALSLPTVFNDERDSILAKWNQLQAFWGTGKGYFSPNSPPVVFTPENPFCRFKVSHKRHFLVLHVPVLQFWCFIALVACALWSSNCSINLSPQGLHQTLKTFYFRPSLKAHKSRIFI